MKMEHQYSKLPLVFYLNKDSFETLWSFIKELVIVRRTFEKRELHHLLMLIDNEGKSSIKYAELRKSNEGTKFIDLTFK